MADDGQKVDEGSQQQKRRLSAIMFTDIKGFSSLMESDEITAVGLVKLQREIVRKYIARHNGEERETIGDAFLVIFDSAINAVRCAIDIQRELWEINQTREPANQVWIRIGIHLGDILIEEGSVFGEGVNLAARVEPLAEPGGVCITRQVYDQIKHHIDIHVSHLGVRDLKNITDVPDIYRIRLSTTAPKEPITLKERLYWFKEKPMRLVLTIAIAVIALAANTYWTFFALHTNYARQIVYINHEPKPFKTISHSTAKKLEHYYELKERAGRVVRLTEVTKPDLLPEGIIESLEFKLSKKPTRDFPVREYKYIGGAVKEERVFDKWGTFQFKLVYDNGGKTSTAYDYAGFVKTFENQISSFAYGLDEIGRVINMENRNAFGIPYPDANNVVSYRYVYNGENFPVEVSMFDSHGNPIESKDGISSIKTSYNEMGLPVKDTYLDRYKELDQSVSGIASVEKNYDNLGRLATEKYFDKSGQSVTNNNGVCAKNFKYNANGELEEAQNLSCAGTPKANRFGFASKKYKYDNKGNVTQESYLDEKGLPTVNNKSVSIIRALYDSDGRIKDVLFFNPDQTSAVNVDGVHAISLLYNNQGLPIRRTFIGQDNNPMIGGQGYAEVRLQYDNRGNPTEWVYFDTEGKLTNSREGYASVKNEYDQYGNLASKEFFDKRKEPVFGRDDACHRIVIKYDERGNLDETKCFDGIGNLTPGIKHCAISRYDFDPFGKLTHYECYITEGQLIDDPNLPSVLNLKYNDRGYLSEVRAFDAKNELAERYQGAAIWKRITDDFGNELEISTYDRNGHLVDNPKYKAAIFRREYDKNGREIKIQAFDQNGKPTTGIWGFAEVQFTYDNVGHKTSESYYDGAGGPAVNFQGVHERRSTFDDRGQVLEVAFLGKDGTPVVNTDDVAFTAYTYDQWGWVTKIEFFGPEHKPALNKELGCSSQTFKLDDRGNVIEISQFDTDGELCTAENCTPITQQQFDSKGRMTKQFFKDAKGSPTTDKDGAEGYEKEYNVAGNVSELHVLGKDGSDSTDKFGVHEYKLNYSPESGRLWYLTFFDAEGKEIKTKTGANIRIVLYDTIYQERQKAKADVSDSGKIISLICIDQSGNETEEKDCVTPSQVSAEFSKIEKSRQ